MAQEDDGLIREVEEELRREQYEKLWKQYGTYILIAAAAIVIAVGGYNYWQYARLKAAEDNGAQFTKAVELFQEGKKADAEKAMQKLASDGSGGYQALARLKLAGDLATAGKTAEAVAAFDKIAGDTSSDELLRQVAQLRAAMLRLDTADWTEMKNRLNDLVADTNPWRFSARELRGLAAFKASKLAEARKEFSALLADQAVPAGIRRRANMMMALLTKAGGGAPKTGGSTKVPPAPPAKTPPAK